MAPDRQVIEVAEGVRVLRVGRWTASPNVAFVSSGSSWSLIDTGWSKSGEQIRAIAASLFGADNPPTSILLTHIHPDHSGSALELARWWDRPVHVHPEEVRFAPGAYLPEYANPLDRWLVGPLLKLVPQRVQRRMEARSSIDDVVAPLDASGCVPGLREWQAIPTPGHTPGHTAFFRSRDRVLIAGDAVLTVDVNNLRGLVTGRAQLSAPPRIATWDWDLALDSVAVLATREPSVLVGGHGAPIAVGVADSLDALGGR